MNEMLLGDRSQIMNDSDSDNPFVEIEWCQICLNVHISILCLIDDEALTQMAGFGKFNR